jgi:hypothetical protein
VWLSGCLRSKAEDPRVNITKLTRRANDLLRAKHENSTALVQNFLSDGTVLVADSSNRGKGSPTFIDSARRLGAEELQTIDDFVQDTHNDGGSLSVRQIADHLMEKHPALLVSNGWWLVAATSDPLRTAIHPPDLPAYLRSRVHARNSPLVQVDGPGVLTCSRVPLGSEPLPCATQARRALATASGTGTRAASSGGVAVLQQVLAPSGMRTSVRDASQELPEKLLPVMLVAVFLTNCCRTQWLLASERRGGREPAVASKACLYCCTLPSPPPPSLCRASAC